MSICLIIKTHNSDDRFLKTAKTSDNNYESGPKFKQPPKSCVSNFWEAARFYFSAILLFHIDLCSLSAFPAHIDCPCFRVIHFDALHVIPFDHPIVIANGIDA